MYTTHEGYNILSSLTVDYFSHCSILSIIIYLLFLFIIVTILLNVLIAQVSDTYAKVLEKAEGHKLFKQCLYVARLEKRKYAKCVLKIPCFHILYQFCCGLKSRKQSLIDKQGREILVSFPMSVLLVVSTLTHTLAGKQCNQRITILTIMKHLSSLTDSTKCTHPFYTGHKSSATSKIPCIYVHNRHPLK